MWDLNGKKRTRAWTFENSSQHATWLVLSWLTPCWGLCPSSPAVTTALQQLLLAVAVTTRSNPTTFLPLPTESCPCHLLHGGLGHAGGVAQWWGFRPPAHTDTYLYFSLLSGYLSLDHFSHPVDCEAAGHTKSTPAKGQVRGRNERWPLGWEEDRWCMLA